MLFYNYIGRAALQGLEQCGAVGDICGQFFDVQGHQCFEERRVLGIPLESLKALREVIGVAGAIEKASAILGALRGGFVDVLVTDSIAARAVLDMNQGTRA